MFVNRRVKFLIILISPLAIFLFPIFLSATSVSDIVINEIAWMGTEISSSDEWIEIYNNTDQTIDLSGWTLRSSDGSPSIALSKSISAKGYFLLERTDDNSVPNITADQIYTGALTDTGEILELKDAGGNLIDSVNCSSGWFVGDKDTKQTMERKDPSVSGNDANNWQNSQNPGGTPKAQNSSLISGEEESGPEITSAPASGGAPANQPPKAEAGPDIIALINQEITFDASNSSDPENTPLNYLWNFGDGTTSTQTKTTHSYKYPGKYIVSLTASDGQNSSTDTLSITIYANSISISEFMPNPEGKDEENEWIELFNNSSQAVDISGWKIDAGEDKKGFSLPTNSLIAGYQYLVLSRPTTKISLNNTSGKARLIYPTGQVAQEIKYDKAPQGQSVSLISGNQYSWSATPTTGTANIISAAANKSASQLNSVITEAHENNSPLSSIIPSALSLFTSQPSPAANNIINNGSSSSTAGDNVLINQENNSVSGNNKNTNQTQSVSAVISKLFQNKSTSAIAISAIIIFGALAGLGLSFLRKHLLK